jgi:hypothetical protein
MHVDEVRNATFADEGGWLRLDPKRAASSLQPRIQRCAIRVEVV